MSGARSCHVEELVCLHRQVTLWVTCGHHPRHQDLAQAVIHALGTSDKETCRLVRSATAGRRPDPAALRGGRPPAPPHSSLGHQAAPRL